MWENKNKRKKEQIYKEMTPNVLYSNYKLTFSATSLKLHHYSLLPIINLF